MKTKKRTTKRAAPKKARRKSTSVRITSTIEQDARRYGFKKKKPKKPKSKTIASLEKYLLRVTTWKKEQAHAAAQYRRLQSLKKRVAGM